MLKKALNTDITGRNGAYGRFLENLDDKRK